MKKLNNKNKTLISNVKVISGGAKYVFDMPICLYCLPQQENIAIGYSALNNNIENNK